MTTIVERNLPSGVWEDLLPHALSIIEDIKSHGTPDPFWTFGGGRSVTRRDAGLSG
jgi:hypothetical protein